jgi:beta-glucuronidase
MNLLLAAALLIANVEGRKTTSLDGEWKSIVDPYEMGMWDIHGHEKRDGYFKDATLSRPDELLEYNFERSPVLTVPRDWNGQRDQLFFYEGTIWYRKLFDYEKAAGRRVFLHFGAANQRAVAYLNGEKLGTHEGGFTPFVFEVTDRVKAKGNFVVVKVDNSRRREDVPALNTDWWNYGGLTRSVRLVDVPETFIEDYSVQLAKDDPRQIAGWVKLNGARAAQSVTIEIPEAKLKLAAKTDAQGKATFRAPARLTRWAPGTPRLYEVKIGAETDAVSERIGFRTIEVKGDQILLNGRPVFLRGICMHEEAPKRGGRGLSSADARTLFGWATEMGANFVRLAHYPHDETTIRAADELGILLWGEIPVYWGIQFDNPKTYENARQQLEEMIVRDRNRASVILWSMANETPINDVRNAFIGRLADEARRLDPTRLVTAALMPSWSGPAVNLDDPLSAKLDVIGANEYIGWYGQDPPEKADVVEWKNPSGKPLIISEFGADAKAGLHGEPNQRFTEEYQERLYRHQIGMLKRIPFLRGVSPWILMDFRSPRRPLPGIQDYWNRKGLVSPEGEKKKAFGLMQEYYRGIAAAEGKAGGAKAR